MTITSPAFETGSTMPERFARENANASPPLTIRGVPPEAESLALIMDDPDAPGGTFTHWIAFNLDPVDQQIPEAAVLPDAAHGLNSWNEPGYGGPQPPSGEHRYFFRVFALDRPLGLSSGAPREQVERAMQDHVIEECSLMARFSAPG
jgi:Raf kinase inhibitor-like YbhB/YbcL family protein